MEGKELSIALREMARVQGKPLCDEWYGMWSDDTDIDGLLDRFVRGFDFCVDNDYPPLDFCRRNFKTEDLHRRKIYLDEEVNITEAENGYYIFLGDCKGRVIIDGFLAVTVYLRHTSVVDVVARNGARVFVTYYDSCSGTVTSDEYSKVKRYLKNK